MAESIRDKVAIVGVGACQFGENWDQSREDMIVDAAYEAYADAGIDDPQRRIEAVFAGAVYPREGTSEVAEALKLFGKPISIVSDYCQTGTDAFRYGVFAVAAGVYDTVLVVGFDKPKDRGVSGPSVTFDRVRGIPATPAGWFSLCAARYFETFGAGREDLAKIAVKNHHNGTLAPKSMLKREITVKDVLEARIISWPFGLYDCAAQSDGAAACVLTRADLAKSFRDDPVFVKAVSIAVAEHPQRDPSFDFLGWKPTVYAAKDAYAQAGIREPFRELDVIQLHDCFTLTELLTYEDLGLCKKGEAKEHVASGTFELGGELPVNTDGGLKTFGHPTGATGVRMIYENALQLQGRAGPRQVPGASLALSHNIGGPPTTCGIAIRAMKLWLNTLRPTRVEMLTAGATEREQQIIGAHFAYWQELVSKGAALLVGRTQDAGTQTVGLSIFEASDEASALALCQADPTVREGVMTSTVQPYRIALLAEREHWSRHAP